MTQLPSKFERYHRGGLFQGDCVEAMRIMIEEGVELDLVVTSPPYADLRTYDGFHFDFPKIAELLAGLLVRGGVIVWVVDDRVEDKSESGVSFSQALYFKDSCGLNLHDTMIWEKSGVRNSGNNPKRYYQCFEYMFVLSKGTPKTSNLIKDRRNAGFGSRLSCGGYRKKDGSMRKKRKSDTPIRVQEKGVRSNIWKINQQETGKHNHPAAFPLRLATDHILSWSNPGDLVYDPFMGSGTTAVAAHNHKRIWLGSEISEEYCKIIRKRMKKVENSLSPDPAF